MTIDQIRKRHRALPFEPFRIHLADGRALDVSHPEVLAITPPGRKMIVPTDNVFEIVDLLLVTSLEMLNGHAKSRARKR